MFYIYVQLTKRYHIIIVAVINILYRLSIIIGMLNNIISFKQHIYIGLYLYNYYICTLSTYIHNYLASC